MQLSGLIEMTIGTTGSEDAWQRIAFVSVESGTSAAPIHMTYQALTETIDIDMGERDLDVINLLNLGQIPKHGPVGICTVTLEGYPLQAGTSDQSTVSGTSKTSGLAKGYFEAFANAGHADTSQPLDLDMSNTLTRYRLSVLWTNQARLSETASTSSDSGAGSITVDGSPLTADSYNGSMIQMTMIGGVAGTAYYHVSDTSTSAFTLTVADKPATDGVADNDAFYVYPTGSSALLPGSKGMRFVLADCFCTSCKTSMTDGIVKQTLVFKGKLFNASGSPLSKMESHDGTGATVVPWLGYYTAGSTYWA